MRRTALVTGSPGRVAEVSSALESLGCDVVAVDEPERLASVCASLGSDALDHYVQLPVDMPSPGGTVVHRLKAFLAGGLLARFEVVATIMPTLRPNASVILVAGNLPPGLAGPDDRHARIALLRVLAQAILADMAPIQVRTAVIEHSRSAGQIAEITLDPAANHMRVISEVADSYPEMSYDDWRLAVLSLSTIES